jgi:K+-sensing histidine kinase KdpD
MKRTAAEKKSTPVRKSTVVCVTSQLQCERIIRAGRSIANLTDTQLLVVNVSSTDFTSQDGEALEHLFRVSKENDAQMTVLYSNESLKTLTDFIKKSSAVNVVTGMPQQGASVLYKMWDKLGSVSFFTVDADGSFANMSRKRKAAKASVPEPAGN